MKNTIIVDSCCDMTAALKEALSAISVPLTMMLGTKEYRDDDSLDLGGLLEDLKGHKDKVGSAAPSPYLYQKALEESESEYIITLSKELSASYSHALLGSEQAQKTTGKSAYVFDSKSASAGETLIAIKLHELLQEGLSRDKIVTAIQSFIDTMKTYFVLENYDNLQRNGRLGKVAGSLIRALNIKLIMGDDGNGNIALHGKTRGEGRMIETLLSYIKESGKQTQNENLVIAHCSNPKLAELVSSKIKERFQFKQIYVVPTGGLSSLYADNKGIIMAF